MMGVWKKNLPEKKWESSPVLPLYIFFRRKHSLLRSIHPERLAVMFLT